MQATEAVLKQTPKLSLLQMLRVAKDPFRFITAAPQRYPDMLQTSMKGRTINMIMNPAIAQHVLQKNNLNYVKDEGYDVLRLFLGEGLVTNNNQASWRKQRTMIQPAFHRESLKRISEVVTSSTNELIKNWKKKEGTVINFTQEMAWLTIDIVSKSLFTTDVPEESIEVVWKAVNYLNETSIVIIKDPFSLPWKFPIPRYIKARKYIKQLDDLIYGIIQKRKTQTNPPHDLLQLLIDARYEDTGTGMTDQQIRDEVMTIFVAGHETTVNALSWIWYLLKQHPAIEEKLKEESLPFAGSRNPVFEDLHGMAYGKMVMNEGMRLYPPVSTIGRKALEDDYVEGYLIKKGTSAVINIAGLHYHPAHWENPYAFQPERFEHLEAKGDNRFVFLPFGGGPRICIGNNFAMMEMQLINAMLSTHVELELISKDVKPVPLITLKPGTGIVMKLKKVKD